MGYTTDWKPTKPETKTEFKCVLCNSDDIDYRDWESSCGAYEDIHYRCNDCKREWWVEGADA